MNYFHYHRACFEPSLIELGSNIRINITKEGYNKTEPGLFLSNLVQHEESTGTILAVLIMLQKTVASGMHQSPHNDLE